MTRYLILFFTILLFSTPATAESLGQCSSFSFAHIVNNLIRNVPLPFMVALNAIALVSGVWLTLSGLIVLARQDRNEPVSNALIRIVVGAVIASISMLLVLASDTLGLNSDYVNTSLDFSCVEAENNYTMYTVFVENFALNAGRPLAILAYVFSMSAGVFFVFSGIRGFVEVASQRSQITIKACFGRILIGAFLFNLPFFATSALQDVFFNGAVAGTEEFCSSPLSHKAGNTGGEYVMDDFRCDSAENLTAQKQMQRVLELSFMAIFPFGLFAVISGLIAFRGLTDSTSANDASAMRAAIVRLIAGALMMNMGSTTCMLNNTIGLDQMYDIGSVNAAREGELEKSATRYLISGALKGYCSG